MMLKQNQKIIITPVANDDKAMAVFVYEDGEEVGAETIASLEEVAETVGAILA